MEKAFQRSSPCIEFALIDAKDPTQVARFMFWLDRGRWPEDRIETNLQSLAEAKNITMEESLEISWMFDAPRHRILKLLWQLLQDNHSEEYFWNRFTIGLEEFTEDASGCSKILSPIQEHLRWVLKGIEEVSQQDRGIGQGNWGEEWFLSEDKTAYVRKQLKKVHFDILEKPSDYQEMLETVMDVSLRTMAQIVDIPSNNPQRNYIGEVLNNSGGLTMWVWVEAGGQRQGLVNVDSPWSSNPGSGFGWGYSGGGSRVLASSLLADATGGDIITAEQYWEAFRKDVVESLPIWHSFSLSLEEVLSWLAKQGVREEELAKRRDELQKRRDAYGPELTKMQTKLEKIAAIGGLMAQRFDYVPKDFESALYIDLMEMLKKGGRILRCTRCGLPIYYDGSSRSNRQRARWETGRPIYHVQCSQETRIEHNRAYWHKRSSDPEFKEQRRYGARNQRHATRIKYLIKQGEGQRIEFKKSFAVQNEAIISLDAFTHADGGTVLFGVNNDRSIVGVEVGENTLENFANTLRNNTEPPITVLIEQIEVDGKVVVTVNIGKARQWQLFYAFKNPYIRVGKINQPMPINEQQMRLTAIRSAKASP